MVGIGVVQWGLSVREFYKEEGSRKDLAVTIINKVPLLDESVVLSILVNIRVTTSDHIGVAVSGSMIILSSIGPNCKGSVSELWSISVIRFIVYGESENEMPISCVNSGPFEPTTYWILRWEGLIASSDKFIVFSSFTNSSVDRISNNRHCDDLVPV